MKSLLLSFVILALGTVALRSFIHAEVPTRPQKTVTTSSDFDLDDSLDRMESRLDLRLQDHDSKITKHDAEILDLQTKLNDCNARIAALVPVAAKPSAKVAESKPVGSGSTGGSTGTAQQNSYVAKPSVSVASGGSTGTVYQNAYSTKHWSHPGSITTHLQSDHQVNPSGMSVEQQLSLHDSIHESQVPSVGRSVTRTNTQSTNCPGGVCPTTSSVTTRTVSNPRVAFPLLKVFRR